MFTGLIREVGKIASFQKHSQGTLVEISSHHLLADSQVGDSIAVNGCCLTVTEISPNSFKADVMQETLNRTCLQELRAGDLVNLEPALKFNEKLGGHLVQGHVDGIGKIKEKQLNSDHSQKIIIEASSTVLKYIVIKGSIAVDGVSLTVSHVDDTTFAFDMIPHTAKNTNLDWKKAGAQVNIETDLFAKYIEKLLCSRYEHN